MGRTPALSGRLRIRYHSRDIERMPSQQQIADDLAFKAWLNTRVTPDAYSAWHGALAHERASRFPSNATTITIPAQNRCFRIHPCMLDAGHEGECKLGCCACPLCVPEKYGVPI